MRTFMRVDLSCRARRIVCAVAVLTAMIGLFHPTPASGQIEFNDAVHPIRYEQYQAVFECRTAITRVMDSLQKASLVWTDTLPLLDGEVVAPVPEVVVAVARRCGSALQFDPRYIKEWFEILLFRNDSSRMIPLVRREVFQRSYTNPGDAYQSIANLLDAYKQVPSQHMLPIPLVDTFILQRDISAPAQVMIWGRYIEAAHARDDHHLAELAGGRVVKLLPGLDTFKVDGSELRSAILSGIAARYRRELFDSLAKWGTESYARFWRHIHEPAMKGGWMTEYGPRDNLQGIGATASPVKAEYWFPSAPNQTIPSSDKLSLIVFMDVSTYFPHFTVKENANLFATLRRMHQKYPDLECTIVWRTLGWFGHGSTVTPKEESEIVRKWLLDTRQLPVRVAIDSTPYYYLPDPDGRRINTASENDANYRLGIAGRGLFDGLSRSDKSVLVDREGRIIKTFSLNRTTEQMVSKFIDILYKRSSGAGGAEGR